MTAENEREIHRALRAGQDKYTYFMLTAAGAAIAFATTQTQDTSLAWSQLPLAAAVGCWGLSFYAGCKRIQYVNDLLYTNADLFRVQSGEHPLAGRHPQLMAIGEQALKEAFERKSNVASTFASLQFGALVAGAICYVAWHIFKMYERTTAATAVGP